MVRAVIQRGPERLGAGASDQVLVPGLTQSGFEDRRRRRLVHPV